MRIITLVTQKGGTGKTTIATSLAVAAHDAGEKVLALDLDPQGSLNAWGNLREADLPHVEQVPANIVADLPKLLEGVKAQGFTLTILDTAGADNPTTHTCEPSPAAMSMQASTWSIRAPTSSPAKSRVSRSAWPWCGIRGTNTR